MRAGSQRVGGCLHTVLLSTHHLRCDGRPRNRAMGAIDPQSTRYRRATPSTPICGSARATCRLAGSRSRSVMRMSAPCASMQHVDAHGGGSLQPLEMCVLSSTEVLSSADIVWHRTADMVAARARGPSSSAKFGCLWSLLDSDSPRWAAWAGQKAARAVSRRLTI